MLESMPKGDPPHWGGWQADRNPVDGGTNDLLDRNAVPAWFYLAALALILVVGGLLVYFLH